MQFGGKRSGNSLAAFDHRNSVKQTRTQIEARLQDRWLKGYGNRSLW
jgi:hypothetical protein